MIYTFYFLAIAGTSAGVSFLFALILFRFYRKFENRIEYIRMEQIENSNSYFEMRGDIRELKQQIKNLKKQTLLLIQQSGYTAEQLTQLFSYVGGVELPEMVTDLNNLLDDYLSQADQVSGPELAALSKLHSFTRMLDSVLKHQ